MTIADLGFRVRQFAVAVLGVSLVLAMTLLLTGLVDGFRAEVAGTVNAVGARTWVLSSTAQGRITAFAAFPEIAAVEVAEETHGHRTAPLLVAPFQVVHAGLRAVTVNLIGVVPGRLGAPTVTAGHTISRGDQAVVDSRLHVKVGSDIVVARRTLHVVGLVTGRTLTGGVPVVYTTLAAAQKVVTDGLSLITAVVTTGTPRHVPPGLVVLTTGHVITNTVGQLKSAVTSIDTTRWLMWLVAAAIVASLLYVVALERRRDFAVLKALGASSGALFFSLVVESAVVTIVAAAVAEGLAKLLVPLFSQPIDLTPDACLLLPAVAVGVGVVASLIALHRVTGADPATAFA